MSTYSCICDCFEKLAASKGYRCDLHREHRSYLNGNTYAVAIADPLTRRYARYRFSDEDLQASGWRISDFAGMVFGHLIDEIRKENEKENEKMKLIDCVDWRADGASISQDGPCSISRIRVDVTGTIMNPVGAACANYNIYAKTVCKDLTDRLNDKERITNAVIKNVIFNPPATIVFWTDGTKTVVKTQNNEPFDPEKGLAMAYFKKMHGNKGHYFEEIKKWTEKYEDQNTVKYTDDDLEAMWSEYQKNLTKFNATVLNHLAAKNDSTSGDDQCQST